MKILSSTKDLTIIICLLACMVVFAAEQTQKPLDKPVPNKEMGNYIFDQLQDDPFIKQHFGWKLAYCQHPMYLLVDEDRGRPSVYERIPPWGAADSNGYVARVRRNLQALKQFPDVKLNYQWSAVEIEAMTKTYPDVYRQLQELYKSGSLDFLDGTYSQAHLHVFGSESNWRQFEYGQEVYRNLFKKNIDVYARQETGIHQQLPQLLKLFGYKFMAMPIFPAIFEITEGPIEFESGKDTAGEAITGDEFIEAVALDGSSIPTYFFGSILNLRGEFQQDLYSGPKIACTFPDLKEITQKDRDKYNRLYDWVLLREALIERYVAAPPKAKAKIYAYWSYTEGVWAEELARAIKKAEEHVLLAEALAAMKTISGKNHEKADDLKNIWLKILKTQHHDISWIEVTDLRRKSINRPKESIAESQKIMSDVTAELVKKDDSSIAVFNTLPTGRKCFVEFDGAKALKSETKFQSFEGKTFGFVEAPAGGFKSFKKTNKAVASEQTQMPRQIKTSHYNATISPTGLIQQLADKNGKNILATGEYLGGEIRARIDKKWYDNKKSQTTYHTGPVCDIIKRKTAIDDIPVEEKYYFFKDQSLIKAQITFDFNAHDVGYMWIDESKINVYYPTAGKEVYQDIPFGYVQAKNKKPHYASNWTYAGGLVYVNRGTPKLWTRDGLIANPIAWGSNHFSNRRHWNWLGRPDFDIRLYGKHTIEYYIIPFGDFDGNKITNQVAATTYPVFTRPGKGEKSFYKIKDENLAVTAVYENNQQPWFRGYKMPSDKKSDLKTGRFSIYRSSKIDAKQYNA